MTPLAAIRNAGELQLKRKKKSRMLARLFGVEGELAGNALKAQKKALRTATLSLLCAFLAFTLMQCFFVTSEISTRETYFERYQDAWDIMATVKDANVEEFDKTEAVRGLYGVESAIVYQKATAKRVIAEEEMSGDMKAFGGFSHAAASEVTNLDGGYLVNAPLMILDDRSFLEYCEQIGVKQKLDGAVILNRIRDVTNPDFRHPEFVPYVTGENAESVLRPSEKENARTPEITIPVVAYTDKAPVLREEYATLDKYELVHFIPASLWKAVKGQIGGAEEEIYVRVLGGEHVTLENLKVLQGQMNRLIGQDYVIESENRIQEYETNGKKIQGMRVIFGGFCVLLAIIGIGDVFSNTLGFVRQRKREFARYMSVGLTPRELKKMFCIEALVIAGRPILTTVPFAVIVVWSLLKMSYLNIAEFLAEAPFVPIIIFMSAIFGSVALAYALAWRNVRNICLTEVLKDDTMI